MIGITQINKELIDRLNKENKGKKNQAGVYDLNKAQIEKKIVPWIFEIIRDWANKGENISIKSFFTLKRSKQKSKESERCFKHEKEVENYKRTNKGKGIAAFAKSPVFKKIILDAKKCNDCKNKKQAVARTVKLLPRLICKTSKNFWTSGKSSAKNTPKKSINTKFAR